jgi:hypothetical protein
MSGICSPPISNKNCFGNSIVFTAFHFHRIFLNNDKKKKVNKKSNIEIKLRLYSQNMPRKLFKNFLDVIEFNEFKEFFILKKIALVNF